MLDKRFIKQLAQASYTNNQLDEKSVNRVVSHLSKQELKVYIKELKNIEKSHTIMIDVPRNNPALEKQLRDAFPEKKVQISVDPSLLLGLRLQDNDDVYEMSLKNTLSEMAEYVTQ